METEAAALLVNRSNSARFEIRGHGLLFEVVDSDREVINFAGRLAFPEDEKAFPEHELVIPLPFIDFATKCLLVVVGRSLQVADLQRDVIDPIPLESDGRRRLGSGG